MSSNLISRRVEVITAMDTLHFTVSAACRDAVSHVVARLITEDYQLASCKMSTVMHSAANELAITYDGLRSRLRSYKKHFYRGCPVQLAESVLGTRFDPEKELDNTEFFKCFAKYVISEHKKRLAERRDRLEQEKSTKIGYIIWPLGTSIEADWELSSIVVDVLNTMISLDSKVTDVDFENAHLCVKKGVNSAKDLRAAIKMYQKFMFKYCTKKQLKHIFKKVTRLPMNSTKFMRLLAEHVVDVW